MKKSIWLAIIGAAALTGCQSEVMQQRAYVPAPHEEPAKPVNNDPYATDNTGAEQVKNAPETAPAVQELPAMTGNFRNEGVSEDAPLADTGKKGARKDGGKGKSGTGVKAAPGEYIVRSGDTPEKIARRHHVRLSALMEANNLTEESAKRLRIGQKLVIPARDASGKGGRTVKGGKKGVAGEAAPAAGPGEYIVKSGDTPEKIARRHHVRLSALMEANNLSEEDAKRLKIGQKLVIPGSGAAKPTAKPQQGKAVKETPAAPADNGGRDLEDGTDAPAANTQPAAPRTEVENGYLVDVPRDMTVAEFARLNNVSEAELRQLNPNMPADILKKESSYVIPKN